MTGPVGGGRALTAREREVAALVAAEGLTARQAAARLRVSVATVKGHVRHIYRKLGIGSRGELLRWSRQEAATAAGEEQEP